MNIDPGYIAVIVGAALVFAGFYAGKYFWLQQAVEETLDILLKQSYLKYRIKSNGEMELIKVTKQKF